jgi:A/G-specific adenine glycosylase
MSGPNAIRAFKKSLLEAAPQLHRALPWSSVNDPWAILVSEVMLQQTQVARVIPAWFNFLELFPTPQVCAAAPLADILRAWQGMGFARRARNLQLAAQVIVNEFEGVVPSTPAALRSLPGVGAYTSHAVASFAFREPVAVLDTNVGRVVARAIANETLTAKRAQELATELLGTTDSAQWNQLMLDLGAQFCRATPLCDACPVASACAWRRAGGLDPAIRSGGVSTPQSRFAGSLRQQRGLVLRSLGATSMSRAVIERQAGIDPVRLQEVLDGLVSDGLIERHKTSYCLPGD